VNALWAILRNAAPLSARRRIVERNRADIEVQILVAHYRGLGDLELELAIWRRPAMRWPP